MGLHTEHTNPDMTDGPAIFESEKRRRIWYSIYVLDRLLSLQLGRPPAIHDEDFHVLLPSRAAEFDLEGKFVHTARLEQGPLKGDYFLAVIAFSQILGQVLREVYGPKKEKRHPTPEDLLSTKNLDKRLIDWKLGLPRILRFDLGHAFEKRVAFKRQVRMVSLYWAFITRGLCLERLTRG
jgi:hypothetical protein